MERVDMETSEGGCLSRDRVGGSGWCFVGRVGVGNRWVEKGCLDQLARVVEIVMVLAGSKIDTGEPRGTPLVEAA